MNRMNKSTDGHICRCDGYQYFLDNYTAACIGSETCQLHTPISGETADICHQERFRRMEVSEKRVNHSNRRRDKRNASQKKETQKEPWEIDWKALKDELTKEKQWTSKDWWKDIKKHLLISFATGFFFSAFDLITDGMSGFTYIFGADYIKNVDKITDPSVVNSDLTTCRRLGHFRREDTDSIDYYQYQCFERDPIWGSLTLAFMFVPGLWADKLWSGMTDQEFISYNQYSILRILTVPLFPLIVILTKGARLVNDGPEMKKLEARVTDREGSFESTLQFGLQLFIVMTRKDRLPSNLQWVTIATSFIMLDKAGLQSYLMFDKQSPDLKSTVEKIAALLPMFITANAFKLGSGALLAVILTHWLIPVYIAACFIWTPVRLRYWREDRRKRYLYHKSFFLHPIAIFRAPPKFEVRGEKWDFTEKERTLQLLFGNVAWFTNTLVLLIVALILVSTNPTLIDPDSTTIVSDEGPTLSCWIIFIALLACGAGSLGLIYWEFVHAKKTIDRDEWDSIEMEEGGQEQTENVLGKQIPRSQEKETQTEKKNKGLGSRWKLL